MTERPQNMQALCHARTLRSQSQREKDHKVQASLGYTGKSSSENTKQKVIFQQYSWCYKPVIPVLGRQGHEDLYQFKDTLGCRVDSRPV